MTQDNIRRICDAYGITVSELYSRKKPNKLMHLRGCLYAYMKFDLQMGTEKIADTVGRNHSSIVTTGNRYFAMINHKDPEIYPHYQKIREICA